MGRRRSRRDTIVRRALGLVERDGLRMLTMRALAAEVGIQAPSLYKHFADKQSLETALRRAALTELDAALGRQTTLDGAFHAYRDFVRARPHLYDLLSRPNAELSEFIPAALLRIAGDTDLARAVWGFAHGLAQLEVAGLVALGADLDAAWWEGTEAFRAWHEPR